MFSEGVSLEKRCLGWQEGDQAQVVGGASHVGGVAQSWTVNRYTCQKFTFSGPRVRASINCEVQGRLSLGPWLASDRVSLNVGKKK